MQTFRTLISQRCYHKRDQAVKMLRHGMFALEASTKLPKEPSTHLPACLPGFRRAEAQLKFHEEHVNKQAECWDNGLWMDDSRDTLGRCSAREGHSSCEPGPRRKDKESQTAFTKGKTLI